MSNTFSSGKHAFAFCDVCGFRYPLHDLRALVVKQQITSTLACPDDWNEDHPQLMLGTFPIYDPQALRNPRPSGGTAGRELEDQVALSTLFIP